MALFKILRGGYQDKPENLTDGWAYFTPDNKGFYIDVIGDVGGFTFNDRIQINEKMVKESATLLASGWTSKTYSLSIDSRFSSQYYTIQIEPSLTGTVEDNFEVGAAAVKANMSYILDGDNSRIFFVANGEQPQINIPITIKFIPKEVKYIQFTTSTTFTSGSYMAVEGMTWSEWLASPFNTDDWYYSSEYSGIIIDKDTNTIGLRVSPSDLIAPTYYSEDLFEQCCFIAGTQVLMADNTLMNIEQVKIGDKVISYDIDTGENYIVSVLNTIINRNSIKMAKVIFDNGTVLEMTDYHPLYTASGWKSLTNHMGYETLAIGNVVKTSNGWSEIINIEQYELKAPIDTYTLDVISIKEDPNRDDNTHDNFYANGIVVHNSSCPV